MKIYNYGDIINGFKFVKELPRIDKSRYALWECPLCGSYCKARIPTITSGRQSSCGCFRHGESNTKLYRRWQTMIRRCNEPGNTSYKNYGSKGISVCDEWTNSFIEWKNYISSLPNAFKDGYSLDRINTYGNYEPGNVRWASYKTQVLNSRIDRRNKSGYVGVWRTGRAISWTASITVDGDQNTLGSYRTPKLAAIERDKFIIKNELWEYPLQVLTHKSQP